MTDINIQELRQAAEKATGGQWLIHEKPISWNFDAVREFITLLQGTAGEQKSLFMLTVNDLCPALTGTGPNSKNNAEFISLFSPANALALLDELEKLQRANAAQNDHINQQADRIETLELTNSGLGKRVCELSAQKDEWERKATSNFEECARMSKRLEEETARANGEHQRGFCMASKRIAELEAELGKADRLYDSQYLAGMKAGWNFGVENDDEGFNKCVELRRKQYAAADIVKGEV